MSCEQHNLRFVLIDDEPLLLEVLTDLLMTAGHQVSGRADTLVAAAALAASADCDVAILDMMMHGSPSFAIADQLLARNITVVMTTGYDLDALPPRLRSLQLLGKPFRMADVHRLLDNLARSQASSTPSH